MSFNRKTILVVDGDKTFVLYMGILLKRMGFNVVPADNGIEVLKLVKLVTPDLIMMDLDMPALDGLETLVRLRESGPARDIPVIFLPTGEDYEKARLCAKAGCSGFLPKPVPMDELHELLQDCIFSSLGFRRKYLRVHESINVIVFHEGAAQELRSETVSEGGLYLISDNPFPVGSNVEVSMPYEAGNLRLNGTVIYIRTRYDDRIPIPTGMAIEFKGLSERDALVMNRYVSNLITGDISAGDGDNIITIPDKNPTEDSRTADGA